MNLNLESDDIDNEAFLKKIQRKLCRHKRDNCRKNESIHNLVYHLKEDKVDSNIFMETSYYSKKHLSDFSI